MYHDYALKKDVNSNQNIENEHLTYKDNQENIKNMIDFYKKITEVFSEPIFDIFIKEEDYEGSIFDLLKKKCTFSIQIS